MNSQVMNMLRANANYNDRMGSTLGSGYIGGMIGGACPHCMSGGCAYCMGRGYIGGFRNAAGKKYKPLLNGRHVGEHEFLNELCGLRSKGPGSTARNKARRACIAERVRADLPQDVADNYLVERPRKRALGREAYNQRVMDYMSQYDVPKIIARAQLKAKRPARVRKGCAGIAKKGLRDYCEFRDQIRAKFPGRKLSASDIARLWSLRKYHLDQDVTEKQMSKLTSEDLYDEELKNIVLSVPEPVLIL